MEISGNDPKITKQAQKFGNIIKEIKKRQERKKKLKQRSKIFLKKSIK